MSDAAGSRRKTTKVGVVVSNDAEKSVVRTGGEPGPAPPLPPVRADHLQVHGARRGELWAAPATAS